MARPRKDSKDKKIYSFRIRMSEEEKKELDWLCAVTSLSRSKVIRAAIRLLKREFL